MMEAADTRVLEALHTVNRSFPVSPLSSADSGTIRRFLGRPEGLSLGILHASDKFHHL